MKLVHALSIVLVAVSTGCSMADRPTADEVFAAIDTSAWKVRPEDYGFTVQEYLHAEHDLFMSKMLARGAGNNFFHFTELVDKDDTWVVSPALDHLYSVFVIDTGADFLGRPQQRT